MSGRHTTRRDFIRLTALAGAGTLMVACGGAPAAPTEAPKAAEPTKPAAQAEPTKPAAQAEPTKPAAQAEPTKPAAEATKPEGAIQAGVKMPKISTTKPAKFSEAPVLADLVKAGKLPPVEQRLPEEPLVVEPLEIGQYGGTLRMGELGTSLTGFDQSLAIGSNNQLFLRIDPDMQHWQPNVAKDVKVSDDHTTFTLTLRKGIKWSDGQPFTSKDYLFWYEDILQNKEIQPSIPVYFRYGGKIMSVTAPDDYTVVIKHNAPVPWFLLACLAHRYGGFKNNHFHPAHYLKSFHTKYNPKADEEAKAAKFNSWFERFQDIADPARNKDLPVITAAIISEVTPTQVKFERNPYFWIVDTEGNQLPYIDTFVMERAANLEMYNAKIVTGAYDYAGAQTSIMNYPAYEQGQKQGNYRVSLWRTGKGGEVFYQVNMTYGDEVLAKIHQDVRYRRALSMAINREEINQLVFLGQGTPRQMTVIPLSRYFKPEYEKAWAEFSVDKANALLDEMGLKWDAGKTIRLRPDGKPMQYQFDMVETETPKGPVTELVSEYWREVGIDIKYKSVTRQLLTPRILANEEPMSLWHGDAVTDILLPLDRKWVIGKYGDECAVATLWHQWYDTVGEQGQEPPDWFKEVLDDFTKFQETMSDESGAKLLQSQADNLWSIGTVGMAPHPLILRNTLRNVVDEGIFTWDDLWTWPYHSETWYFKA